MDTVEAKELKLIRQSAALFLLGVLEIQLRVAGNHASVHSSGCLADLVVPAMTFFSLGLASLKWGHMTGMICL